VYIPRSAPLSSRCFSLPCLPCLPVGVSLVIANIRVSVCTRSSSQATAASSNPQCRSSPRAPMALPRSASRRTAVRHLSPSRSMACLCSMRLAPMPPLTLPQTFAPSANRRATSIPICSSRSTQSATTRCASHAWTAFSATAPRPVRLRAAQERCERPNSGSKRSRTSR
jgi:hypothetical protein